MSRPAENQQTVEALAATVMRSHAHAMEAFAADVHPYSVQAIRDNEAELELALRDLVAQAEHAQAVVDAARVVVNTPEIPSAPHFDALDVLQDALARLDGAR